jgi:hypothetical protein
MKEEDSGAVSSETVVSETVGIEINWQLAIGAVRQWGSETVGQWDNQRVKHMVGETVGQWDNQRVKHMVGETVGSRPLTHGVGGNGGTWWDSSTLYNQNIFLDYICKNSKQLFRRTNIKAYLLTFFSWLYVYNWLKVHNCTGAGIKKIPSQRYFLSLAV